MLCLAYTYSRSKRDWLDTAAHAVLVELSDCHVGIDMTHFLQFGSMLMCTMRTCEYGFAHMGSEA